MPSSSSRLLNTTNTVLLVVDMQEKFAQAIPTFGQIQHRIQTLIKACDILNVPVIVSEQYPKGLGHTIEGLLQCLPSNALVLEKMSFGCGDDETIANTLKQLGKSQVIVCGIEAHVCVNQTVHQLLHGGYEVHLVQDAIDSRKTVDRDIAVSKMQQSGSIPSSLEMVLFELMQTAKHPQFKAIQSLVK
jgi:nicotinamidase-related amidase